MAAKKNSRSSKTDHVLSLLSGGGQEHPTSPEKESGKEEKKEKKTKQSTPKTSETTSSEELETVHLPEEAHLTAPILQVARSNSEALSHTIKDALEEQLAEDIKNSASKSADIPEVAPLSSLLDDPLTDVGQTPEAEQPEQTPETKQPTEDASEAGQAATESTKSASETEQPVESIPEPEQPADLPFAPRETLLPDGAVCTNVMELMVDDRLERYVRMFGLCSCPRCLADARALALTRLAPKYVVLSENAARPMLSFYQAKFENEVIAQVIQACKIVMENPRHTL